MYDFLNTISIINISEIKINDICDFSWLKACLIVIFL